MHLLPRRRTSELVVQDDDDDDPKLRDNFVDLAAVRLHVLRHPEVGGRLLR